jgi:hypothetical protein
MQKDSKFYDFDWKFYTTFYSENMNELEAYSHYLTKGKWEGRYMNILQRIYFLEQKNNSKKIAVLFHLGYLHLWSEIRNYLDNFKYSFDLYINLLSDQQYFLPTIQLSYPRATVILNPNKGRDIGGYIQLMKHLLDNQLVYDYYLFIHSKGNNFWRRIILECLLPTYCPEKIFQMLHQYQIVGSHTYLFNISTFLNNAPILINRAKMLDLKLQDLFHVRKKDYDQTLLDPLYYFEMHSDFKKLLWKYDKNQRKNIVQNYSKNEGKNNIHRFPHPQIIESYSSKNYQFYAGTMFWITHTMFKYFLDHMESLDIIYENLEEGNFYDDLIPRQTHSYEYWFGILASHFNYPHPLMGINIITFLVHEFPSQDSFIMSFIKYTENSNLIINIQLTQHSPITKEEWLQKHQSFLNYPHKINIFSSYEKFFSLVYIVTHPFTFNMGLIYYQMQKNVIFLCQEFHLFYGDKIIEEFYKITVPTFTSNYYLHSLFRDERILKSVGLNVDIKKFYFQKKQRNGICLFPMDHPLHLKISSIISILDDNDKAKLFNTCLLGIYLDKQPSQICMEMVACGLPCMIMNNAYTQYDFSNDIFIKIENEEDIIPSLQYYLNNPSKIEELSQKCLEFAMKNFYPNKQEQSFYEFINV